MEEDFAIMVLVNLSKFGVNSKVRIHSSGRRLNLEEENKKTINNIM